MTDDQQLFSQPIIPTEQATTAHLLKQTTPNNMGSSSSQKGQGAIDDEAAYFQAIPWCAKHLTTTSSPPAELIITPVWSRQPKLPHSFNDALFSATLRTRDTIRAFVCFYPGPEDRRAYLPRLRALVALGDLVAGYGGLSHGGVVATVLDETLSLLAPAARWNSWLTPQEGGLGLTGVVTAYLNIKYVRPVTVPGTYLVTVWLVKKEGRKVFVEGKMEDEGGVTVASAEALFIESRGKL